MKSAWFWIFLIILVLVIAGLIKFVLYKKLVENYLESSNDENSGE